MNDLFESVKIGNLELRNRFVRSATWEGLAKEDGTCTEDLVTLITRLAEGEVGLIITSHAYIRPEGKAGPWQIGIHDDCFIEGLKKMTGAVHERGGKIVMQISHAGCFASSGLIKETPLAPSRVEDITGIPCHEMSMQDIAGIIEDFGRAAFRAKDAGFDGVQIHAAHGYLLSQFLSPAFNRRTDEYGGGIENRMKILIEVLKKIKSVAGQAYPVLVKMNCSDFQDNGLNLEESLRVGEKLQEHGIDAIEISGGTPVSGRLGPIRMGIKSEEDEAYFREESRKFKECLGVPLILVGGIRSYSTAEKIIGNREADFISMSRPFIREPGLVARWESGDHGKAACISDGRCFSVAKSGKGIYCVIEEREEKKKQTRHDK